MTTLLLRTMPSRSGAVTASSRRRDRPGFTDLQQIPVVPPIGLDTAFVLVSFEGPDRYSKAGGLGVRATGLSEGLASLGFDTHLFYVGDPDAPGSESRCQGRLHLHRWCQWLSKHHRAGVYDGEEAKREDLCRSLPPYLVDAVVGPRARSGRKVVVICEEWQTADLACQVGEELQRAGWGDRAVVWWNANNTYGFDWIDWPRLSRATTVLAVSRWMRHVLRARGVDARVVPNGVPRRLLTAPGRSIVGPPRRRATGREVYFKMARWSAEKGWPQVLDAVAAMKQRGRRPALIARCGGPDSATGLIGPEASARGLTIRELDRPEQLLDVGIANDAGSLADVTHLRFPVSEGLARYLYATADAVLANAAYEPFGLVGLEAMAAGGLVFTSGTGEDYAVDRHNAVVLQTLDPMEIVDRTGEVLVGPDRGLGLRTKARETAWRYEWLNLLRSHLLRPGVSGDLGPPPRLP